MADELPLNTRLDLNRLTQDQRLSATVSTETPDERSAKLKIKNRDAWVEQITRILTAVGVLVGILGIGAVCVQLILEPMTLPETRSWAQSGLSALISGSVLFLTGRASAGKRKDE
jgi:hypothetical protein